MDHIKERLEPNWSIERIIDWGAGTGSGLWYVSLEGIMSSVFMDHLHRASSHALQKIVGAERMDLKLSESTLMSYIGIEKRVGLSRIGKRLLKGEWYFL
jgi:hypothetical protein